MNAKQYAETTARTRPDVEIMNIQQLKTNLARLGYQLHGKALLYNARIMSSSYDEIPAGTSWPEKSYQVREIDTKLSAYNCNARRDKKYQKLQLLRQNTIVLSGTRTICF